jgi:SpoVK/Ycf46/Vps4 family AAA+-type ATPase
VCSVASARGVLLHGPSGCGKTLLARTLLAALPCAVFAAKGYACCAELRFATNAVRSSDLLSRYLGGTEKAIRELFARARRAAPSVVWLDEIDALAASRADVDDESDGALARRTLSALLAELDGVGGREGVLVLAATSRLALVDSALLRPGRFDRLLLVPPPDRDDRREVIDCVV